MNTPTNPKTSWIGGPPANLAAIALEIQRDAPELVELCRVIGAMRECSTKNLQVRLPHVSQGVILDRIRRARSLGMVYSAKDGVKIYHHLVASIDEPSLV